MTEKTARVWIRVSEIKMGLMTATYQGLIYSTLSWKINGEPDTWKNHLALLAGNLYLISLILTNCFLLFFFLLFFLAFFALNNTSHVESLFV